MNNLAIAKLAAIKSRADAVEKGGPSFLGRLEEVSQADVQPLLNAVHAALTLTDRFIGESSVWSTKEFCIELQNVIANELLKDEK